MGHHLLSENPPAEMTSVEAFGESLLDDDRTAFNFTEAEALAEAVGVGVHIVVRRLRDEYGFTYEGRVVPKRVRGFLTSSHDRYFGPGCMPSHGGSGWEQVLKMAGQEG